MRTILLLISQRSYNIRPQKLSTFIRIKLRLFPSLVGEFPQFGAPENYFILNQRKQRDYIVS